MPRENHDITLYYDSEGIANETSGATSATVSTSTWTCRRCGRAFPRDELTNDLCMDGNRYGGAGCFDEDEDEVTPGD